MGEMRMDRVVIPFLFGGVEASRVMGSPSSSRPDTHASALEAFYGLGGNCLHLHGEGGETHSRTSSGEWLNRRCIRGEFILCLQIGHDDWDPANNRSIVRFSAEAVAEDISLDIKLLQSDYLDIVYLDDHPELSFEPVLDELGRQYAAGRIRAVGVRNWLPARLEKACEYAERVIPGGIAALITTELSLPASVAPLWPGYVPFCVDLVKLVHRHSIAVFAHASDFTSGQCVFGGEDAMARMRPEWVARWNIPVNERIAALVAEICVNRGVTSRAVCLSWLLSYPCTVVPILGLSDLSGPNRADYIQGMQLELSRGELEALNAGRANG